MRVVQTMVNQKCIAVHAGMLNYAFALCLMEAFVSIKRLKSWPEFVLLLEHPPVITLGRRATEEEILCPVHQLESLGISIHRVDRGGLATYHGPGQMVGYLLFDLNRYRMHPSQLVDHIEKALIALLAQYGIAAQQSPSHRGVWVERHKIASIGISVRGGISFHGFALNCNPDLSHFDFINPCGLGPHSMTSMSRLSGKPINPQALAHDLMTCLQKALSFDMTEVSLEKLVDVVYNERPEAFTGILSCKPCADKSHVCHDVRNPFTGQSETDSINLHNYMKGSC